MNRRQGIYYLLIYCLLFLDNVTSHFSTSTNNNEQGYLPFNIYKCNYSAILHCKVELKEIIQKLTRNSVIG